MIEISLVDCDSVVGVVAGWYMGNIWDNRLFYILIKIEGTQMYNFIMSYSLEELKFKRLLLYTKT
jgi:hypothetical protein